MLTLMTSIRIVLAISVLSVASTASGQQSCETLASLKLPSIAITSLGNGATPLLCELDALARELVEVADGIGSGGETASYAIAL